MIMNLLRKILHFTTFLAVVPFLILKKFTKYVHIAELISLIPFRFGEHVRYQFYKRSLVSCGKNVVFSFGTILSYDDITVGNNVWFGVYCTFGHIDIGDNILIAQCCHFVSGAHQHAFDDLNTLNIYQLGHPERIKIGPDIWVGANSTVMANIGHGCVVGAGSVVTKDIPDFSVAAGNPARIIRTRN